MTQINDPVLWKHLLPVPKPDGHKYDRGIAVIYGAPSMTGATRLAAMACARVGAGLVKVIAPKETGVIYRSTLPAHIIVEDEELRTYQMADGAGSCKSSHHHFMDKKCRAVLIGPGTPPDKIDKGLFYHAMRAENIHGLVLDAGGFQAWEGDSMLDFQAFSSYEKVVVTPHEGEFRRFFESHDAGRVVLHKPSKEERAAAAANLFDAAFVLKGSPTVIAQGNGEIILNERSVPQLATAGSGDVLAGMITGLLAQGMDMLPACAAAVWIHAEAGWRFGQGLVASDLPDILPEVLRDLQ